MLGSAWPLWSLAVQLTQQKLAKFAKSLLILSRYLHNYANPRDPSGVAIMKRKFHLAALAAVGAIAIGGAFAAKPMENDALAITQAKIPMTQAVTAAEQHVNGKAARAEYEQTKADWVYDVEVISGAKVFDVKVDGDKGTIISSAEDKADHDDDHDEQD
jgi:uncharacterized membrane protein YkoI